MIFPLLQLLFIASTSAHANNATVMARTPASPNFKTFYFFSSEIKSNVRFTCFITVLNDTLMAFKPADITLVKTVKSPPSCVKLAIAGMCVIAGVAPEKSTDPAAKKNVTIHTKENVKLKKKIRVKSSACLTVLTCSKKLIHFSVHKTFILMTKTSCWLRFGYSASLLQTNFLMPRLKKWVLFWVLSIFTVVEVGGLTGVVFSIYKSTLILNKKLINNFCLHTHLFHKIRGKGLLELHFVSIMHLLTASYLDTIYLALICRRPLTLVFSWISMLAPVHTYPLHWQQDVTSISCNYFQRKEKKTEISDVSFPFIYLLTF